MAEGNFKQKSNGKRKKLRKHKVKEKTTERKEIWAHKIDSVFIYEPYKIYLMSKTKIIAPCDNKRNGILNGED